MKESERRFANPCPGTYLLTVSLAQQGYRLTYGQLILEDLESTVR